MTKVGIIEIPMYEEWTEVCDGISCQPLGYLKVDITHHWGDTICINISNVSQAIVISDNGTRLKDMPFKRYTFSIKERSTIGQRRRTKVLVIDRLDWLKFKEDLK